MSDKFVIFQDDCLQALKEIPSDSIDSLVTDPPAGISFMGKKWDGDKGGRKQWVAWMTAVMTEAYRVLKPGAHGLVWALPRTSHWTATAIEDAGFEIRDVITHLFGQGFPKSLNVEKAGAKGWAGWGTALKPAAEFWILVRKPCSEKTVAANVQKWGTGALNIDMSRIPGAIPQVPQPDFKSAKGVTMSGLDANSRNGEMSRAEGRFPANLVLSHSPYCTDDQCDIECATYALDLQSGTLRARGNLGKSKGGKGLYGHGACENNFGSGDTGGASRFFYCAKISASERNVGLDEMPDRKGATLQDNGKDFKTGSGNPRNTIVKNHHPTVKPIKLMTYLIRMITPPEGLVLDPFAGSGSTGVAAIREGFRFLGIEQAEEYVKIAEARLNAEADSSKNPSAA